MPSFFDSSIAERWGAGFIVEGKIDDALRRLIGNAHISKGHFSYPSGSELRDLVWNHMDQMHRPFIHRTYGVASRIHIGRQTAFSLTRFGKLPLLIPVFDGYFKENGFYQVLVLFGLIAVVNVIECNVDTHGTKMDVTWTIASHRWLRFLHPLLHRRLVRLNDVQNREDDPMRDRRIALRAAGYRFKTDDPDFVNSNVVDNNTLFPAVETPACIPIHDLPDGSAVQVPIAERAYVLKRDGSAVDVWPGVCPHEGAELGPMQLDGKKVKCPWHGLEFAGRRLTEGQPGFTMCGAHLQLGNGTITISQLQADARTAPH